MRRRSIAIARLLGVGRVVVSWAEKRGSLIDRGIGVRKYHPWRINTFAGRAGRERWALCKANADVMKRCWEWEAG